MTLSYRETAGGAGRWRYWIDAVNGEILNRYNDIKDIQPPTNGVSAVVSGALLAGENGATTNIQGWLEDGNNSDYLHSTNRHWDVFNIAASGTYPDLNTFAHRTNSNWGISDRAEISAARNFEVVQEYYRTVHNRNSFNNSGITATANVHIGTAYVNAYWDGASFNFGDGDGSTANSLAVLDVCGHEYTHAVTEYTAGLVYLNEPGALNESFSDVIGECVEFYSQVDDRASYPVENPGRADWLLGEDCWVSSTALRDMRNPANPATVGAGNEQPTRYLGTYWYSGVNDNGGVHQNSGVQNFFFYLLCEGGSGNNDGIVYNLTGIGITNAQHVAYRALTIYTTANAGYRAVRTAWLSAAQDLNPAWVSIVRAAWDAVGVQAVSISPIGGAQFSGGEGGPFSPASVIFTITNSDSTAAGWGLSHTQAWVSVAPSGGTLPAFGGQAITVLLTGAVTQFCSRHVCGHDLVYEYDGLGRRDAAGFPARVAARALHVQLGHEPGLEHERGVGVRPSHGTRRHLVWRTGSKQWSDGNKCFRRELERRLLDRDVERALRHDRPPEFFVPYECLADFPALAQLGLSALGLFHDRGVDEWFRVDAYLDEQRKR